MKTLLSFLLVITCTIVPLSSFAAENILSIRNENGDLIPRVLEVPAKRLSALKLPTQVLNPQSLKAFN